MKIFVSLAEVSAEEKSFVANVGNTAHKGSTKLAKNKSMSIDRLRAKRKAMALVARKLQKAFMDHKKQLEAIDAELKQIE